MTDTLTYEVRRVRGEKEMAAALELRHEVFCVEQGVPEHEELDGRDREGIHLVAVVDGEQVVATCRLLMVGSTAQFSRLAVRQIGTPPRDRDGAAAGCRPRDDRRWRQAARCSTRRPTPRSCTSGPGYRTRGRRFTEAKIEHIAMEKTL